MYVCNFWPVAYVTKEINCLTLTLTHDVRYIDNIIKKKNCALDLHKGYKKDVNFSAALTVAIVFDSVFV